MDEKLHKQMLFEENRKSKGVAYRLWLFFGWFGVHRFYAGKTKSGVVQLLLTLTGVGLLLVVFWWWLIDALLIPGMVNERNMKTIEMLNSSAAQESESEEQPREETPAISSELDSKREAMLKDLRQTGYRKERRDNFSQLYR